MDRSLDRRCFAAPSLSSVCACLVALTCLTADEAFAQAPRLQLDKLDRLQQQASEVVNITLDPSMLQLAAGLLSADQQKGAGVKELVSELKGIYVKSFEFDRDGVYTPADVQAIRDQLAAPGWSKIIATEDRQDQEIAEVYAWRQGNQTGGFAILVAEPRELTVVNILGPIDLAKLVALQGTLGIPRLQIERQNRKGR